MSRVDVFFGTVPSTWILERRHPCALDAPQGMKKGIMDLKDILGGSGSVFHWCKNINAIQGNASHLRKTKNLLPGKSPDMLEIKQMLRSDVYKSISLFETVVGRLRHGFSPPSVVIPYKERRLLRKEKKMAALPLDDNLHGIPMTEEAFEYVINLESPYRYELIDGIVYDMTGSSPEHGKIAGNIFSLIHAHIKRKGPCEVYQEQYVKIPNAPTVVPDVVVTCDRSSLLVLH